MKVKKNITSVVLLTILSSASVQAIDTVTSGKLEFTRTIPQACGIQTPANDDFKGGINFEGDTTEDKAKFTVHTNTSAQADITFDTIIPSTNITGKGGYFKINQDPTQKKWNSENFTIQVNSGELQEIAAFVPVAINEIDAGDASVSTIITVACSNQLQ